MALRLALRLDLTPGGTALFAASQEGFPALVHEGCMEGFPALVPDPKADKHLTVTLTLRRWRSCSSTVLSSIIRI